MSETRPPAKSPCGSCPYRRDAPSGLWHASEYLKLALYDGSIAEQALAGAAGAFHCHQQDGRLCAGWVGCHDMEENFAVRINAKFWSDEVLDSIFDYETDVPLWGSGAEAMKAGMAEYFAPGEKAERVKAKLKRKGLVRDA